MAACGQHPTLLLPHLASRSMLCSRSLAGGVPKPAEENAWHSDTDADPSLSFSVFTVADSLMNIDSSVMWTGLILNYSVQAKARRLADREKLVPSFNDLITKFSTLFQCVYDYKGFPVKGLVSKYCWIIPSHRINAFVRHWIRLFSPRPRSPGPDFVLMWWGRVACAAVCPLQPFCLSSRTRDFICDLFLLKSLNTHCRDGGVKGGGGNEVLETREGKTASEENFCSNRHLKVLLLR